MPKTLIALMLACVAAGAQAQNTAEAIQFRIDMCAAMGKRAANAFSYKEHGKPYPMDTIVDGPMRVLDLWSVNYGTTQASDRGDASRAAIAKCIDNIDRVYRDSRHGHTTALEELQ